jgi:hypothetical protein
MSTDLPLTVWAGRWAVGRMAPDAPLPDWATLPSDLTVIARSAEELSIAAPEEVVPADVPGERGFRVIKVDGPIPFLSTGIIASLATPLATAGIAMFPISTHDTDYVLVKEDVLTRAVDALRLAGWNVKQLSPRFR